MQRQERTLEREFKERVLKEIEKCLEEHPLYKYRPSDLKGYRLSHKEFMETGSNLDPSFYIDHLYIDWKGRLTQHPYAISMERLESLIEWCRATGHRFYINGHSCYFPNETFAVIFEEVKEG